MAMWPAFNDMQQLFRREYASFSDEDNHRCTCSPATRSIPRSVMITRTRYINGAKAKNVMVADGCVIEGEVENSVLFRGVKIGKGAKGQELRADAGYRD